MGRVKRRVVRNGVGREVGEEESLKGKQKRGRGLSRKAIMG
jgi:hypothetical protein